MGKKQLIKDWCGWSWNMEAQFETSRSMTGILGQLKWESLKERRNDSRLIILLYKGLNDKARIPTDDLIPKNRLCRNQHSLAFSDTFS